eukprot:m.21434 g.21434  ORF g.21434 m.21434 type:complete len:270 (+) comp6412_c0_seq1:148-957(+)
MDRAFVLEQIRILNAPCSVEDLPSQLVQQGTEPTNSTLPASVLAGLVKRVTRTLQEESRVVHSRQGIRDVMQQVELLKQSKASESGSDVDGDDGESPGGGLVGAAAAAPSSARKDRQAFWTTMPEQWPSNEAEGGADAGPRKRARYAKLRADVAALEDVVEEARARTASLQHLAARCEAVDAASKDFDLEAFAAEVADSRKIVAELAATVSQPHGAEKLQTLFKRAREAEDQIRGASSPGGQAHDADGSLSNEASTNDALQQLFALAKE